MSSLDKFRKSLQKKDYTIGFNEVPEFISTGNAALNDVMSGDMLKGVPVARSTVISGLQGTGKEQSVNTRVQTPLGPRRFGDLIVGDQVLGKNGRPTTVTKIYPQGIKPSYQIIMDDGTMTFCGLEHLWSVRKKGDDQYQTLTLSSIIDKFEPFKWELPVCDPVEFTGAHINPQHLHKILGSIDGSSPIPYVLEFSSIENRVDVFENLIKNCGSVTEDGVALDIADDRKVLASVRRLIWSLGGTAYVTDGRPGVATIDVRIPLYVSDTWGLPETRCPRRFIEHIQYAQDEEQMCISVDADDHLYLTDCYIVTHNTFLMANVAANAQTMGYHIIYLDTEFALGDGFMEKIGVDMGSDHFTPMNIGTIEEAMEITSEIFKAFPKEEKIVIMMDSLSNLVPGKDMGKNEDGEIAYGQGLQQKLYKQLVTNVNNKVGTRNAAFVFTSHLYQKGTDSRGNPIYKPNIGDGTQFLPSIGVELKKSILKDENDAKQVGGININASTFKTRFTKLGKKCSIALPWDTGMDFYDGAGDVLEKSGILDKNGAWFSYTHPTNGVTKFQKKDFSEHADFLMEQYSAYASDHRERDENDEQEAEGKENDS